MKRKLTLLLCSAIFVASPALAQNDEDDSCWQKAPERSPNPIIEFITIPLKMAYVLTLAPRCLVASIPKNEE